VVDEDATGRQRPREGHGRVAAAGTGAAPVPTHELRVRGPLDARAAAAFADLEVHTEIVLRAVLVDQAALHGVLDRIRELGLELVDVRPLGGEDQEPWR
jgi:hypothetical protein